MFSRLIILVSIFSAAITANAGNSSYLGVEPMTVDFAAPVVPGTSNVTEKYAGRIILDSSAGQNVFKGVDTNGNWVNLSTQSGATAVTSYASSNRMESVQFGTSNSNCTAGSPPYTCDLYNSSGGSWVTVTRTGTGVYTLAFNSSPAVFSAAPTCVCSAMNLGVGLAGCSITSVTSAGGSVQVFNSNNTAGDAYVHLICTGPK